ncbi:PQQ-binding-like beta-propeller repeat protein [Streptomyces sp. NPDC056323]|uniref:outer membrane protein assembly factor BamB family protein n=1 Tax=Streptomyces sp. NPDC056323 TaxID=3345784 RepID=UPI0035DD93D7
MRVLGGRYELVAFIGRGGMGEVWEGHDRVIERRVAVKLLPHDRRDTSGAELFFREARTAGGLSHAGVVTIFDLGQDPDDGTLYLVMEFLAGRDLDTVLREDGLPEVATAVDWVAQTAEALQAAHTAGVVHRDLKPANLMLTRGGRVKVLDFGIARYIASTHKSSKVIGTLAYMPPERFGDYPADARSDLYSLGCVLHELLTGKAPFQATDPVALMAAHLNSVPEPPGRTRPGVPAALDDLVMALLAKNPDDRPAAAAEVHERLRERPAETLAPVPAPPTPAPVTAPRPPDTDANTGTTALATVTATAPDAVPPPEPGPDPSTGAPAPTRALSRRTALRLGIGAAAGAGIAAAVTLFDQNAADHESPDATSGNAASLRWRYTTGDAVTSSPTVADGVVYIGSDDKNVYALDAATGKKKWAYATGRKVEAAPTVAGGVVYAGSLDNSVYALDAATGKKKWAHAAGHAVRSAPTVAGRVVYVGSESGVFALDTATGDQKWRFDTLGGSLFSSPAVVGGDVYVGNIHSVYALDAATGARKWIFGTGSEGTYSAPMVVDGVVYVSSVHSVYALDAATGRQKWVHGIESNQFSGCSAPAVVDGAVYVGNHDSAGAGWQGRVFALDAATGRKKWQFDAGDSVNSAPTVAGGVVYVGSDDRNVYALDAATGKRKWAYATGDMVKSSPTVAAGVVYVGSNDKNVYALRATVTATATAKDGRAQPRSD